MEACGPPSRGRGTPTLACFEGIWGGKANCVVAWVHPGLHRRDLPGSPCPRWLGNSEWTVAVHQGTWGNTVPGGEGSSESPILTFQPACCGLCPLAVTAFLRWGPFPGRGGGPLCLSVMMSWDWGRRPRKGALRASPAARVRNCTLLMTICPRWGPQWLLEDFNRFCILRCLHALWSWGVLTPFYGWRKGCCPQTSWALTRCLPLTELPG